MNMKIKVRRETARCTIVRTWSECKELVLGYPSIYKSFYTEEDLQQKQ